MITRANIRVENGKCNFSPHGGVQRPSPDELPPS